MCHLLCPNFFTIRDDACECIDLSETSHFHSSQFPSVCNRLVYKTVDFRDIPPSVNSFSIATNTWKYNISVSLFKSIHETRYPYKMRVRRRHDRPYFMIRDETNQTFGSFSLLFPNILNNDSIDVFVQPLPVKKPFA